VILHNPHALTGVRIFFHPSINHILINKKQHTEFVR